MRISIVVGSLVLWLVTPVTAEPGRIGVQAFNATDISRPGSGGEWRSIDGLMWYPAKTGGTAASRATYFAMAAGGTHVPPDAVRDEAKRALSRVLDEEPSDDRLEAVLREAIDVYVDAEPDPGPFPIVLVSAGLRSPPHAVSTFCERIARAGHIVVAIRVAPLWPDSQLGFDQVAVETMMRDLETTLGIVASRPYADSSRVAAVGWSIGSVANVLLQMRNPLVDALVSLDGGVGYAYGAALAQESTWFRAEPQTTPLLDVRALGTSGVPRAFDVLDLPRSAPKWLLEDDRLTHGELTAMSDLASRVTEAGTQRSESIDFVHDVVVTFLDSVFDGDHSKRAMADLAASTPDGVRLRRIASSTP